MINLSVNSQNYVSYAMTFFTLCSLISLMKKYLILGNIKK